MFYKEEKIALFIDGSNLYASTRLLGFDVDYKMLREEFMKRGRLVRAYYYTVIVAGEDPSPMRALADWLQYNGYELRTKLVKEYTDSFGRRKSKGSVGVELAVDAMEIASKIDHAVLFSGDGDYRPLVSSLQRQGLRVSVVSTLSGQTAVVSDELRRQADSFIDLDALREVIGRP